MRHSTPGRNATSSWATTTFASPAETSAPEQLIQAIRRPYRRGDGPADSEQPVSTRHSTPGRNATSSWATTTFASPAETSAPEQLIQAIRRPSRTGDGPADSEQPVSTRHSTPGRNATSSRATTTFASPAETSAPEQLIQAIRRPARTGDGPADSAGNACLKSPCGRAESDVELQRLDGEITGSRRGSGLVLQP